MIFIKKEEEFSYEIALNECSYEIRLCCEDVKEIVASRKFDAEDATIYEKLFENASYIDVEAALTQQDSLNEIVKHIKEIRAFTNKHKKDNICDIETLRKIADDEKISYSKINGEEFFIKKEYLLKAMEHEAFSGAYRIGTSINSIYFGNLAVNIISIMFYGEDWKQIGLPLYFVEGMID